MALAAAVKGGLRPAQQITWTRGDTGVAEDLTGATITGTIRSTATGVTRAITGTLTITTAAAGVFTWTYSAADVADEGLFEVQFTATFGASPTPARTVAVLWEVSAALAVA